MRPRSLILIILIVLLPTGLLTWFGLRMARDEKSITEQRFRSVMEQRLQDVNRLVERQFSETERRLQRITAIDGFSVPELRERVRSTPQVTQVFVLTPSGELLYPNPGNSLNGTEQSFLRQAARMLTERDLQNAVASGRVHRRTWRFCTTARISANQHANVFRPFSRLSNDLRASTGTGIGLAIARNLARLHNGDLRLMDSAQGCWFRAELESFASQE